MTARRARPVITPRLILGGAAATLALAAGSTVGVAAAGGGFTATSCTAPVLTGVVVKVTAVDMRGMPMTMMGRSSTMRLVANPTVVRAGTLSLLVRNAGSRKTRSCCPTTIRQPTGW